MAIIRGARLSNPYAYGVSVGPNRDKFKYRKGDMIKYLARHNLMQPTSTLNLDRFLAAYADHGRYLLVPAHFKGVTEAPEPFLDLGIGKYDLDVKDAWTIGAGDMDASILDLDDPPFVPPDEGSPPAIEAMKMLAELRSKRGKRPYRSDRNGSVSSDRD
jgi:hypothetical protein